MSMIIPNPSKVEIIGKRIFSETIDIEDEDQYPKKDLNLSQTKKWLKFKTRR